MTVIARMKNKIERFMITFDNEFRFVFRFRLVFIVNKFCSMLNYEKLYNPVITRDAYAFRK